MCVLVQKTPPHSQTAVDLSVCPWRICPWSPPCPTLTRASETSRWAAPLMALTWELWPQVWEEVQMPWVSSCARFQQRCASPTSLCSSLRSVRTHWSRPHLSPASARPTRASMLRRSLRAWWQRQWKPLRRVLSHSRTILTRHWRERQLPCCPCSSIHLTGEKALRASVCTIIYALCCVC